VPSSIRWRPVDLADEKVMEKYLAI